MVRKFPTGPTPRNNPLLSHTFVVAFIAATIAIVSFLCGKKKRKRSHSSNNHTTTTTTTDDSRRLLASTTDTRTNEGASSFKSRDSNDDPAPPPEKALPPPPRLANIRAASYHIAESSSRAHGAKLTSSMSMRLSGGLKGLKKGPNKDEKRSNQILENDKLTREDSVWKKTIILGEKCRIPDEDEEDIILDENGQRIMTFHRKQSCSSSMSRRSSDVNQDAIRN